MRTETSENKNVDEYVMSFNEEERAFFANIKFAIGKIQFEHLSMSKDGKAIEANPSTHRIALVVYEMVMELKRENKSLHDLLTMHLTKNQSPNNF